MVSGVEPTRYHAMSVEWYYSRSGNTGGPVSSAQLHALAKAGQLQPTDLVWKAGMAQWVSASRIERLFAIVLGRDPTCDCVLNDPMISWRHAQVVRSADGAVVEDLGSSNGTFVNGKRVKGK